MDLEKQNQTSSVREPEVRCTELVGVQTVESEFLLTWRNRWNLLCMAVSPATHGVFRFGLDGKTVVNINQTPTGRALCGGPPEGDTSAPVRGSLPAEAGMDGE